MKFVVILVSLIFVLSVGVALSQDVVQPHADFAADATVVAVEVLAKDQPPTTEVEEQEGPKKPRVGYGLMVGLYNPVDSEVRDLYGSNWVRFGLRPLPIELPKRWRFTFDVSYYSMSNLDNRATLIPITFGYLRALGNDENARGYVAVNAGPYYGDVKVPPLMIDKKGWGLNANATVGLLLQDRWSIEARYDHMSEFAGLDFSAITISAAYRILTARM